jgi:hypothetical protein
MKLKGKKETPAPPRVKAKFDFFFLFSFFFLGVLGIRLRALNVLGKCSTNELHPKPKTKALKTKKTMLKEIYILFSFKYPETMWLWRMPKDPQNRLPLAPIETNLTTMPPSSSHALSLP